ncbi:hypothetical protein K458DRAFT_315558, partial [Lentithecium fluviatile CBS 122367]
RLLYIKDSYLINAPRSSRLLKQAKISKRVINTVRTNHYEQEKSYANIIGTLSL